MPAVIDTLLASDEPSIRWRTRVRVLREDPDSPPLRRLREEVRTSPRVRALLDGHAQLRPHPYAKWRGAHWVLLTLADLGYPPGDESLRPLLASVLDEWCHERFEAVPTVDGRHRRCASQQGGALLAMTRLGLPDGRASWLADRLQHWQWPDGGWNCDRRPQASTSSVHETLLPMRALGAYGKQVGDPEPDTAARRAAEALLSRRVVYRRGDDRLVHPDWTRLRYPAYWHYDLLSGLKGMAELGFVRDDRCRGGLELLESQRLPDGGWPARARHYRSSGSTHRDHVDWGGVDSRHSNPWVTTDALAVLTAAGRA